MMPANDQDKFFNGSEAPVVTVTPTPDLAPPSVPLAADPLGENLETWQSKQSADANQAAIESLGRPSHGLDRLKLKAIAVISGLIILLTAIGFGLYGGDNQNSNNNGSQNLISALGAGSSDPTQKNLQINFNTVITNGKQLMATGQVLIQNSVDSTNSLQIQNAAGNTLLVADTVNQRVGINTAKPAFTLDTTGDINSSTGLRVGGVLICTVNGCISSNLPPQQTIDTTNVAFLNGNQTFSSINKFTSGSNVFAGDGSGLSALNASNISSGTLSDNRLSANVALLNGNQTFTGNNTFNNQLQAAAGVNSLAAYSINGTAGSSFSCAPGELLQQAVIQGGIITSGLCVVISGGTTPTLQEVYDASLPSSIVLSAASGVLQIQDAASPLATNLFEVTNNGAATKYFAVNNLGISVTGNVNTTGQYQVGGVQISSSNLSNDANLAKLSATQTFAGDNTFSSASNSFTGNGSGLTSLNASNLSSGTVNDLRLSANVTLQGNTFNGAGQLVQLTGGGLLPALNGSNLTNLDASNLSSGTVNDARLSTNVTLAGNTFNGASQLVQLTAGGILPVLSGANLTSLNASNISSGTLNDSRLSGNVALLNANNTFTGNNSIHLNSTAFTVQDALSPLGTNLFEVTDNAGTTKYFSVSATGAKVGANDICTTAGNCAGVAGIGGSGTPDTIAKFTGTGLTIGDSLLSESGATVTVGGTLAVNTITPTATLTVGTSTQTLTLQGDGSTSLSATAAGIKNSLVFATPAVSNKTITLPNASGTVAVSASGPLALDAAGNLTCPTCLTSGGGGGSAGVSSVNTLTGDITLAGTANQIVITPAGNTLTFSTPQDIATTSSPTFANVNVTGQFKVGGSQISSANLSNDADLAKLSATQTFAGDNTFSSASNSFTGNGSGLTSLNASNISSGTLNDARLSSNVPLKNAANIFTNTNQIQATNAAAFQIQNSGAADTLFTADTTARGAGGGNLVKIGNSTGTDGNTTILQVDAATADPTSNLGVLNGGLFYNSTTNKLSIIENGAVKVLCNKTDLGCGSTPTTTLAQAYANGASQTDSTIALDSTRLGVIIKDNATPISGSLFTVQNSAGGTKYFDINTTTVAVTDNLTVSGTYNTNTFNSSTLTFGATSAASIDAASGQDLNLGTSASNHTTTLGSTNGTSTTTVQSGSGGISLNGNATVAGTNTFTVNGGLTSLGANLDVTSSVAFKHGTDVSTTGNLNNLAVTTSLIRLTGASLQTLTGVTGGRDGQLLTIVNAAGQAAVINDNDTVNSSAGNRIRTGTGANISLAANSSITLVYDNQDSFWRVVGDVAGGTGSGVTTVGTFTSCTSFANGAQIASNTITFSCADITNPGMVSTGAQTWAGAKTFNALLTGNAGLTVTGGAVSLTGNTNSSLTTTAGTLSLQGFGTTSLSSTNRSGAATSDININTGNVTSGAFSSGSINIDVGTSTGTNGTISIGSNASALALGNLSGSAQTTIQSGSGGINLSPSGSSNSGVLVKPGTNSTAAFRIQNSGAADTLFTADTTARGAGGGNIVKIGNSTGTDGNTTILQVDAATADPTSNLGVLNGGLFYNSTTNKLSIIENGAVKVLCNTTDQGCGTGSTLQTAYTASTGGTTPEIVLDATRGGLNIQDRSTSNGGSINGTLLSVNATAANDSTQGASLFSVNSTGQVLAKNSADSTAAFQIQNAAGTNIFAADTTNSRIGIDVTYSAMATPSGLSAGAPTNGGSLSFSTTYFYKVTAMDSVGGETPASNESSNTIAASGTNRQIPLTWTAVTGANAYRIYRSTSSGTEVYLTAVNGNSYTDNGSVIIGTVSPPGTNTAFVSTNNSTSQLQLSVGGLGSPVGQVYVGGVVPSSVLSAIKLYNSGSGTLIGLAIKDHTAYVTDLDNSRMFVVDITNPVAPLLLNTITTGAGPVAVSVQGKYLYLAAQTASQLEIYNISIAGTPTLVGTQSLPTQPQRIYVQGRYAYITTGTGRTLNVVDISNPASPVMAGRANIGQGPIDVFVSGSYAYVTNSTDNTVQILNVSNPANITTTSTFGTNSQPNNIWVQGRYAYVTSISGLTLQIFDVSNPSAVTSVSSLSLGFSAGGIYLQGRYLYVTLQGASKSLAVIDVSAPGAPFSVGTILSGSLSPQAVIVQGRYAYVPNVDGKLVAFDMGGAYIQQLQAGGTETGTLQVNGNTQLVGDVNIGGGLQVGTSAQISGNAGIGGGLNVQGSTVLTSGANLLGAPSAPTVTPQGTTGAQRWDYTITAVNAYGGETTASTAGTTATGNATLTGTNFNRVTWSAVSGATSYKIYRTFVTGATSPTTTGLIGTTSALTFDDTGLVAAGNASPTTDTTGQLTVQGSALFKNTTNSTNAFQIQTASSSTLLNADTTNGQISITGTTSGYSDEFNGASVDPKWTFTGNAGATATEAAGKLTFTNGTATDIHDCYAGVATCLRLLETPPTGDFTAEIKLDTDPATSSQGLGILVWKDSSNFIRFELDGTGKVAAHTVIAGSGTADVVSCNSTYTAPTYIRVTRTGNVWTLLSSTDGSVYLGCGNFTQALDLSAGGAGIGPLFENTSGSFASADFDYFHLDIPALAVTGSTTLRASSSGLVFDAQATNGSSLLSLVGQGQTILLTLQGNSATYGQALFQTDSTTALQIQNAAGSSTLFNADTVNNKLVLGADMVASNSATGTTATTSGTGTNTTTVTLTGSAFTNGDVIFIDNAGQDYYTRITAGGGTASLTVTPAVTFETGRTVTKYTVQNIGATTSDYTTQANRFYQGYFLGGVVTGAGSTVYSDANISSATNLKINTASGVNIQGTNSATAFQVQNASSTSVLNVDTINSNVVLQGINSTATFGAELATSPTCSGTNWSGSGAGPYTHTVGSTANLSCTPPASVISGATYQVVFTVGGSITADETVQPNIGGNNGQFIGAAQTNETELISTASTASLYFRPSTNFNGTITLASVKQWTQGANSVLTINNSNGTTGLEIRSGYNAFNNNTFIGVNAGQSNVDGQSNTALGRNSLPLNTSGLRNTAVGEESLRNNTTGNQNTALGTHSLYSNTTGSSNSGTGYDALYYNTTGNRNTTLGDTSLRNNTTGNQNTALGSNSLYSNTTGSNNTALGYAAGYQDPLVTGFRTFNNLQNATAVGYGSQVQMSNSLILGGQGGNAVNVGIGTTSPTNTFSVSPDIYDTGTASTSASATVVGAGTTWTANMVGMEFIFANGNKYTITGFTDTTHMTLSASSTNSSQAYRIHNPAFYVSSTGSVGIRTSTNSTTAFQIQNAAGDSLFNIDTAHGQVKIAQSTSDYSDEFNGSTVDPKWTLTAPDASTVTEGSGSLTINPFDATGATTYNCWVGDSSCIRVMETPPTGDFVVETHITTTFASSNTGQSIIVWQNNQNFIRFELAGTGSIYTHSVIGNVGTPSQIPCNSSYASGAWIKVYRSGNNWTVYASSDGSVYAKCGVISAVLDLSVAGAGIGVQLTTNSGATIGPSSYDYFHVVIPSFSVAGSTLLQGDTAELLQAKNAAGSLIFSVDTIAMRAVAAGLLVQPASGLSDGAGVLQVMNKAGTVTELSVDTSANKVQIGSATTDAIAALLIVDSYNQSSDPTEVDGAMYYNSSKNSFRCGQGTVWVSCIGGLLSSNTSVSSAIANTAAETNFSLTYSLPANYCVAGRTIRWTANGLYSTTGAPNLTFKVKAGSTALATSPTIAGGSGVTNRQWRINGVTICNAAPGGAAATETQGILTLFTTDNVTQKIGELSNTATTNLATNGALTLQISLTWGTANASNTATMRQFIIEGIGP